MKSATLVREVDARSARSLISSPLRYLPVHGLFVNRAGRTITQSSALCVMTASSLA